jgi:hypothetical protein
VLEGFTVRGARFHRMSDLPSGGLTTSFRTPAAAEPHPAA